MHYRAFSENLLETNTANKGTPSPQNGNTHATPECIRGGGLFIVSEFKIASLCLKLGICD